VLVLVSVWFVMLVGVGLLFERVVCAAGF
jgi:hypothetical protein